MATRDGLPVALPVPCYTEAVFRFPPLTPVVRTALIVFLVAYVGLLVTDNWLGMELANLLALSTMYGPELANVWQVFTYAIAQDTSPNGVMGFLVSAIFFWLVVAPYEQTFGKKRTMQVLAISLLGGSLPAIAVGLLLPGMLYGFGPLILGPLVAYLWAMKTMNQTANFFGVMEMKPVTMIWVVLALGGLQFLASRNWLLLAADLGACGAGVVFTEWLSKPPTGAKRERKKSGGRRRGPQLQVLPGGKDDDPPQWLN